MKPFILVTILAATASLALAVKLINRDSTSHDLVVKCSSTAQTSIGGSSTRDLGNGPCTVTVKKTGSSATASGSQNLMIQNGSVTVAK
ncbi:MAG: hypothetical protein FJW30_17655 [Acidobacteria bacterium]|nr:hypothetical protein [Acidobacteriota bacterium]